MKMRRGNCDFDMVSLEFERLQSQEEVRKQIQKCEGIHSQQVCYSTFHDALTQVCYGCRKIRSNRGFCYE